MLSISREDRGAYTCRAYSIQGEAVHTTRLLVQGQISHPNPFGSSSPTGVPVGLNGGNSVGCSTTPKPPTSLVGSASPWLYIPFVGWRNPLNWGTAVAVPMNSWAPMAARFCSGSGEKIEAATKRLVR